VIALPRVFEMSRLSVFSYTTPCMCICQVVWLTCRFKVINSLMQDAWVSSYKQTDRFWPPIFRTTRQQQMDHPFRYSLNFPSVAIMASCWNVLQEDDILCELCAGTCSDVSDYSDNENVDSDRDVPTASSHKQLW